jgi:hypothetical protein
MYSEEISALEQFPVEELFRSPPNSSHNRTGLDESESRVNRRCRAGSGRLLHIENAERWKTLHSRTASNAGLSSETFVAGFSLRLRPTG